MDKHDDGFHALDENGVLRSFHANGTVLDYLKLSNAQIQHVIHRGGHDDHLAEVVRSILVSVFYDQDWLTFISSVQRS